MKHNSSWDSTIIKLYIGPQLWKKKNSIIKRLCNVLTLNKTTFDGHFIISVIESTCEPEAGELAAGTGGAGVWNWGGDGGCASDTIIK